MSSAYAAFNASLAKAPVLPKPRNVPLGSIFDLTMDIKTPLYAALLYVLVVSYINHQPNRRSYDGPALKSFVVVHNIALSAYSAWTWWGMVSWIVPHLVQGARNGDFKTAYCDHDNELFPGVLGYYGYLFYLSKYYEFIDTFVILLKGKKSSALQTYHHAGAIISMYVGIKYLATPIWGFVVWNSFIHTIMYFYYLCSTLSIPFPGFLKRSLTTLQITQLITGFIFAQSFLWWPNCTWSDGQRFAIWVNCIYYIPLLYLFFQFYITLYLKGGSKAKEARTNAKLQKAE